MLPDGAAPVSRRSLLAGAAALAAAVAAGCASEDDGARSAMTGPAAPSTASRSPGTTAPPQATTTTTAEASTTTVPTADAPASFAVRGPAGVAAVALTFHTDGDPDLVGRLADLLAARTAGTTWFVVGSWLAANPAMGAVLAAEGFEPANHTWDHPGFAALAPAAMADEIERCRDVLAERCGTPGDLFRPSGTADGTATPAPAVLAASGTAGYPTVLGWDVEPFDYQDPGAEVVAARVLAGVGPGSIVSLHAGHAGTLAALPAILDGLDQRGLRPVTASQLLAG